MSQSEIAAKWAPALQHITPQVWRAAWRPGHESILVRDEVAYGGRSRAAIQASARYAASMKASTPTTIRLPP